jgi:2,3-bisphosphoglycerate-dependent phosphoglycerate mutase
MQNVRLVLLRHGESVWNLEGRFTGWVDVDLTDRGKEQAWRAGRLLAESGFELDVCYTSLLKRAIRTLWIALDAMDRMWLPVHKSWRLNERHYGGLQGLSKGEMDRKVGAEQVKLWRRSFDVPPPPLEETAARTILDDRRYADVDRELLPRTESLKDALARVLPFWRETIEPELVQGHTVLVAAHGNSLRALVKHLDGLPDSQVVGVEIPTGEPLVYELDDHARPRRRYYLGEGGGRPATTPREARA